MSLRKLACILFCLGATCVSSFADQSLSVYGPSVMVDPALAYYREHTPERIAAEVRERGYGIVRYVLTADSNLDPELVKALHRERIGVWYVTFANGTCSTKDLPKGWQTWEMVTRSDLEGGTLGGGYTRLCLNNPEYRRWKKSQIAKTLARCPFQGVDIVEPHWPDYPGVSHPAYACFCPSCEAAFRKMFPDEKALPNIIDDASPMSPEKNPELWRKWLKFRQASLTAFLDDLVNGPGGIREKSPRVKVATWSLALSGDDGFKRVLEDNGEDAGEIARIVKPDLHCFQTHWPDWLKPELKPDYVDEYKPFIRQIRAAAPDIRLMIQADIGSKPANRRSREWIEEFERRCRQIGVKSTTLYEFSLGE